MLRKELERDAVDELESKEFSFCILEVDLCMDVLLGEFAGCRCCKIDLLFLKLVTGEDKFDLAAIRKSYDTGG